MNARALPLSQGKVALLDSADLAKIQALGLKWCVNDGYAFNQRFGRLHRWLLGASAGVMVDHVDGNKLNNQRANLRFATNSQNQANRKAIRGLSRFKGVCRQKRPASKEVWVARIVVDGHQKHLGSFDCEVAAARAYNEAAQRYFGAYAHLNQLS